MENTVAVIVEIWIWFVASMATVAARFAARRIHAGRWRLQIDDWLMLAVVFLFSASMATDQVYITLDEKFAKDENPDNVEHNYAVASMLILFYDHLSLAATWLCKACMLIMLYRLTLNLKQNIAIKFTAVYTGLSYAFIMITFIFVWCRPQKGYLEIEPENDQCMWPINHLISIAVLNVTSDLLILGITIPLLIKARLPLRKKATIIGIFSLGLVTVAITLLNRILAIVQTDFDLPTWNIRETGMSVIVSNLPLTVPLLQRAYATTTTIIHNYSISKPTTGTFSKSETYESKIHSYSSSKRRSRPASALVQIFRFSRPKNGTRSFSRSQPDVYSQSFAQTGRSRFGSIPVPVSPYESKPSNTRSPSTKSGQKSGAVQVNTIDVLDGIETVDIVDLESGPGAKQSWLTQGNAHDFVNNDAADIENLKRTTRDDFF